MTKPLRATKPASQGGMFLIEVLVALLLFVVGILGMVKAMAITQAAQTDAQIRTEAASLANEIVQTIWLTAPRGLSATDFNNSLLAFRHQPTAALTGCSFSGNASTNAAVTAWAPLM